MRSNLTGLMGALIALGLDFRSPNQIARDMEDEAFVANKSPNEPDIKPVEPSDVSRSEPDFFQHQDEIATQFRAERERRKAEAFAKRNPKRS